MSDDQTLTTLERQINELASMSEEDLYQRLGAQMKQAELAENNPTMLNYAQEMGEFDEPEALGLGDNLKAFGRRWWEELEPRIYNLLCTNDNPDRDKVLEAIPGSQSGEAKAQGKGSADAVAYALAPLIVGLLPVQIPLIASLVAMIAAKTIVSSGLKTACTMWSESIEERKKQAAQTGTAPAAEPATDTPATSEGS